MTDPLAPVPQLTPPEPEDIVAATEDVRAAEYPDLPADLVAAVLTAERDNLDDRYTAARAVGRAIDAWLTAHPAPPPVAATPSEPPVPPAAAADNPESGGEQ